MTYTHTATITGVPIVRANPTGGADLWAPDSVDVARNTLATGRRDTVRVTITSTAVELAKRAAYLTVEDAHTLATAILTAADLNPDTPQTPQRRAGGIGAPSPTSSSPGDRALRLLDDVIRDATAAGVTPTALRNRLDRALAATDFLGGRA